MKKMSRIAVVLACALAGGMVQADEQIALADGGRIELGKTALSLIDGAGKVRATIPMRAEQLDVRGGGVGLAVMLDSASQHARLVSFDSANGTLQPLPPLPVQSFGVDALCLFRDQQGIDQLFVAGKDGQAEQWLLHGDGPRLIRKLALPPGSKFCKVDDLTHALYVDEPKVGTWAYEANSEAMPARTLLQLGGRRKPSRPSAVVVVQARTQTEPVARMGDVADDPAIWIHPVDPSRSLVLGTNKKQGLLVYDLQGKQRQFLEAGRLNNVDLRQGVLMDGKVFDLAVATQRDDNSIVLFGLDGDGKVTELTRFSTGFRNVYGICLFQPRAGGLDVIVNDKSGAFRQFGILRNRDNWHSKLGREFKVASQPEGCVADDRTERLFVGEEKRGVWTLAARSDQSPKLKPVIGVGKILKADVEGMTIYKGAKATYLVVSSQGDNSYVVLDALPPFHVRGRFMVGFNLQAGIDGTSDTDGLDVTEKNLGAPYRQGMLVIQDGYKRMPESTQNFKYVSWEDVANALAL